MYLEQKWRNPGVPAGADEGSVASSATVERHRDRVITTVEHACVLFTDVVGSTWLWEQDPDRMADALTRHDAILESTIVGFGGRIFKWTGDGCCAAFPVVGDAPAAALALRNAFVLEAWPTAKPLRVRVALHAGPVRRHRVNDLVGPTLNQASRLLEVCDTDQVLATAAGLRSLQPQSQLPAPWRARGLMTLRDVSRPLDVYAAYSDRHHEREFAPQPNRASTD